MSSNQAVKKYFPPAVGLLVALSLLLAFSLQYPLSTTFPIGGDASSHIISTQTILSYLIHDENPILAKYTLKSSYYPLSQLIFASSAALPVNWPDRFVWWITLGHILTGFSIGALLWRIGSWRAAAAGMLFWALTPVGIGSHFEDGTAPQLWSLIFMILTFERLAANSVWGTLTMTAATVAAHFLSGFVLIISLVMAAALLLPVRHRLAPRQARLIKYLGLFVILFITFGLYKVFFGLSWPYVDQQSEDVFLLDILKSKFTPIIVLSIPGIAILVSKLRRQLPVSTGLLSFFWFSFLLTTNSTLNVGLWENRFRTYFIVSVCLAAGLALPKLIRHAFRSSAVRIIFLALLFGSLASLTWRDNAASYRFYEDEANNARLSSTAQQAFIWMRDNLPLDSYIVSSAASRQTEWIPVLTSFPWQYLSSHHPLLSDQADQLLAYFNENNIPSAYIVFLTQQEKVPAAMLANPELFPVVFENSAAIVIKLP